MFRVLWNTVFFFFLVPYIESDHHLNEYIHHFEAADYDKEYVNRAHHCAKTSLISDNNVVPLKFSSHGHSFNIILKRDFTVFSSDLSIVDGNNKPINVDISHVYHGHIPEESGSAVFGSILDGHFEGKIISPTKGNYYVEKASRYFPPENTNSSFHTIIYKESDLKDPFANLRAEHENEVTDSISEWMERIQNSAVDNKIVLDKIYKKKSNKFPNKSKDEVEMKKTMKRWKERDNEENETPYVKHSRKANFYQIDSSKLSSSSNHRTKRAFKAKKENKNTCSLFIQTDPSIWFYINRQVNFDRQKTVEEILSLIAHHVSAVNYIYGDSKFDGLYEHRNIKFKVHRIKIDDDYSCSSHHQRESNPFCTDNINVTNMLNIHSLNNYEDFCLAYVFTYRDFYGLLGLSWHATPTASGGICEKFKTYIETIGGKNQINKRSLNTGIITLLNYNRTVPPQVSQLMLAHEIGHNFGSPDDYPLECKPGEPDGNFIMFPFATSGNRPNNRKFSSCSIMNISNVLDALEENNKKNCFIASEKAFCGNNIVEEGEECDCGYDDNDCNEKCCYPRIVSEYDKYKNSSAKGCQRRSNTECSPSQGPCCSSETCKLHPSYKNITCRFQSECLLSSICDGATPECPIPAQKASNTHCNEGTQLCINGECIGSICLEWGLQECSLTSDITTNIDKHKLCILACQNGTDNGTCRSSSEFANKFGLPDGGISLPPGSPCDNFQGYCDEYHTCRAIESPYASQKE